MAKEYVIWGTKNGSEDIVRINGKEAQNSFLKAGQIKRILESRGEFQRVRIQEIDLSNSDIRGDWVNTLRRSR
jgi:hypothetical protein